MKKNSKKIVGTILMILSIIVMIVIAVGNIDNHYIVAGGYYTYTSQIDVAIYGIALVVLFIGRYLIDE